MKRLTACLLLVLLAGATGAEAFPWPWKKAKKLPQPIDSPIVRPKNKSAIKSETMKHRGRFEDNDWGREQKILDVKNPREGNHSIFVD
jgi:hypothetical protein